MNPRPDWDEHFLRGAEWAAEMGTCSRLKVGALIVRDRRVIATGHNGAWPSGARHCDHSIREQYSICSEHQLRVLGCAYCNRERQADMTPDGHCAVARHAEINAIEWARERGIDVRGATMYVTVPPCNKTCAPRIIDEGIRRIVFRRDYRGQATNPDMLARYAAAGVAVEWKVS